MVSDKDDLRERLLAARRARPQAQRDAAADAICIHALAHAPVARASSVAIHVSMASEPGTAPLVTALLERGTVVWAPVVAAEHVLTWVRLDDDTVTVPSRLGMAEPTGPARGPLSALGVDLVIVPALAVDHAGHRLGRGGGYYDRALVDVNVPRYAVVFSDELLPEVPHEPHDEPVHAALSDQGVTRFAEQQPPRNGDLRGFQGP